MIAVLVMFRTRPSLASGRPRFIPLAWSPCRSPCRSPCQSPGGVSCGAPRRVAVWAVFIAVCSSPLGSSSLRAQEKNPQSPQAAEAAEASETTENQEALAQYADAANFQTNGELELAIEAWQKFLDRFPSDPLAPMAAHYMGVCYMQLPTPNHGAAAKAFELALKDQKYGLREESLSNLGWCRYAAGSDPEAPKPELLGKSIEAYAQLMKEHPRSRFADRALFYSGEALYALDKPSEAIKFYDQLLKSPMGEKSALRCDAMYARGLALEDLKQYDQAVAAYRGMLEACGSDSLASAVRLQLADLLVLQEKYPEAEKAFSEAIAAGGPEQARSIYRRAFVLTQMDRAAEAAAAYEALIKDFPESPYAASALMAAAQSYYRAGQMEEASQRFQQVIDSQSDGAQADRSAATEAAHWLSVLALREGQIERAEQIAREQIAKGTGGPYQTTLRLDAAEALSMQPEKQQQALAEFEKILSDAPADPLAPRTLYNAAFTALQIGQPAKALAFTADFSGRFAEHPLAPDMRYIAAESHLMAGDAAAAATEYTELLKSAGDNPQRPLWVLRAASAALAAGQYDQAIEQLQRELDSLPQASQKAEAHLLIGSSYLASERPAEAAEAFQRGLEADPQSPRTADLLLRLGSAQRAANNAAAAEQAWRRVIADFVDSRAADQARYQLAQQASDAGKMPEAVALYTELLRAGAEPALRPFALYGRGWSLLQLKEYQPALEPLNALLTEFPEHSLADDARLARGITLRRLGKNDEASEDLQAFLQHTPAGTNLGHALYELAMIDREQKQAAAAVEKLRRVVAEVSEYPALASVLYELAWALRDAGQEEAAAVEFAKLVAQFPDAEPVAEASYFVGEQRYAEENWKAAADAYLVTVDRTKDPELREKAFYRLGWSHFQSGDYAEAVKVFTRQLEAVPAGKLVLDALMMRGESHFKAGDYEAALAEYGRAKAWILEHDGENRKFSDPAEQQVRELVFLHAGQSAGQLGKWKEALAWFDQMRARYSTSSYLPQLFYETGFAHQQLEDDEQALKFYAEVADNYRDEFAARARFMMGEIYFKRRDLARAIPEFKRVMYGFGAEKAPAAIQEWQAKSGFEAGRCAELLIQNNQGERRERAIELAKSYYQFVIDSYPQHSLAAKAQERVDVLERL